jgi:peptidoglycan/LPS O-acetylase OafA/YrhL
LTSVWQQGGWIGVDLFFVLSGYLVSGLLFKEYSKYGRISLRRFFVRRGFKIYPPFYFFLIVTLLVSLWLRSPLRIDNVLREVFFVQNYGDRLWDHTWSLAVEEHFYILLPLLLLFLIRRSVSSNTNAPFAVLPGIALAIGIVCLSLRIITASLMPYDTIRNVFATHLRIDSLMFGVLLSYFHHCHKESFEAAIKGRRQIFLLGAALFTIPAFILPLNSPFHYTVGFTLLYLAAGMALCAALDSNPSPRFPVRAAAYLGSLSYSIYLWHMPVNHWIAPRFGNLAPAGWGWYMYATAYLTLSAVVGIVCAYLVEVPAIRIRDRFFPSRSSGSV